MGGAAAPPKGSWWKIRAKNFVPAIVHYIVLAARSPERSQNAGMGNACSRATWLETPQAPKERPSAPDGCGCGAAKDPAEGAAGARGEAPLLGRPGRERRQHAKRKLLQRAPFNGGFQDCCSTIIQTCEMTIRFNQSTLSRTVHTSLQKSKNKKMCTCLGKSLKSQMIRLVLNVLVSASTLKSAE